MIPLEKLTDGSVTQRNFEKLALRAADTAEDVYKVALSLGASWAAYDATNEAPVYSRIGRLVVLQGLVTKTGTPAAGDTIGTLPAGFRPAGRLQFDVATGATDAHGRVQIESSGEVKWQAGNTTEKDFTSLSGICFVIG